MFRSLPLVSCALFVACSGSGPDSSGPATCDDGMNDRNGTCVPCGFDVGMQVCDTGEECRLTNLVPDRSHVTCVQAGGLDQPCEKNGACGTMGLSCQGGLCQKYCGVVGLACCAPDVGFSCEAGGDCRAGTCEACGGNGQVCCGGASCNAGFACDQRQFVSELDGHCRPCGGSGGGGGDLPDCSGAPWTSRLTFHIFLQVFPSRCLVDAYPAANSVAEAQQCALGANPGTEIVNDLVSFYQYHSYDDQQNCTNHSLELRKKLGVPKPEMTFVLKQGLGNAKIVSKGQARATTYFAATA
jgi:hypothetical protein